MTTDDRPGPSRRRFLTTVGLAAGGAALLGVGSAQAASATDFDAADRALVLRLAAIGAVFPIRFPTFDEAGSALSRATNARLDRAMGNASASRLAAARSIVRSLLAASADKGSDVALLDGLARLAATANTTQRGGLLALVALGVATISSHFDPDVDGAAAVWLGGLAHMHNNGTLSDQATRAGVK